MAQLTHTLETPPLLHTRLGNQNHNGKFIALLCVLDYRNWCALLKQRDGLSKQGIDMYYC